MKPFSTLFFLIIMLILALFMTVNPRETVQAAAAGFELWFRVLVPALLPFFIVADLLISLHFVNLIGLLLEPVMRPVFRLPGSSALVIAMGFTSGFPMGAVLSRRLLEENLIDPRETERLVSFTNNCSPLFIIGAIGVGMFSSPAFGYLLAFAHYSANLLVGFLWGRLSVQTSTRQYVSPAHAFQRLWIQLSKDDKGIGSYLGGAVRTSINNLLAVGGFVVLFSVMTRMFTVWGLMDHLARLVTMLLGSLGFSYQVSFGICMGLFEVTLGAQTIAATSDTVLIKLLAVSLVLAFSGFSIIAQVMSIVAGLPVRLSYYLLSRLLQMSIAIIITWTGYSWFLAPTSVQSLAVPVHKILYAFDAWHLSICLLISVLIIIAVLMIISLILQTNRYPRP